MAIIWLTLNIGNASAISRSTLELVQAARQRHQLPAIAILIQSHGHAVEQVAPGVRRIGGSVEALAPDYGYLNHPVAASTGVGLGTRARYRPHFRAGNSMN